MTTRIHTQDLWNGGAGGYHTYRIPALAITTAGTILAFCEGRRHGSGDAGEIELLLRRSVDGGMSWSPSQVVDARNGMTCGNPAPVVDRSTGTVWLLTTRNRADAHEDDIRKGRHSRTVWVTSSDDDGITWADPVEVTSDVKRPEWTWYATGPCHGIQLRSGRLLIPCDHRSRNPRDGSEARHSHVIISDDHGATWRNGGIVDVEGTNESVAVETDDGGVYLNCRDEARRGRRIVASSLDGGLTFSPAAADDALPEPTCQASAVSFPGTDVNRQGDGHALGDVVLFANPASGTRDTLTIRLSVDGARSWVASRVIEPGPAAYCDLAVTGGGSILCMYETGSIRPYERLVLARFDLGWVTSRDHE